MDAFYHIMINSINRKYYCLLIFILQIIESIYIYSNQSWELSENGHFSMHGKADQITILITYLTLIFSIYLAYTSPNAKFIFNKFRGSLIIFLFTVFWWVLHSLITFGLINTLYSPISPDAYLTILFMLLGGDKDCWNLLKKVAPYITLFYFIYTSFFLLQAKSMFLLTLIGGNTPVTKLLVTGIWWLAFSSIDIYKEKRLYKYVVLILALLLEYISFTLTYRSWMIQCFFIIIIILIQMGSGKITRYLLPALLSIFIYYVINEFLNTSEGSDLLMSLNNKNQTDTRSYQYIEVFKQIPLITWLLGGGIDASYVSSIGGARYRYIDNQFLLMLFHYGILMFCSYFYIWFHTCYKNLISRKIKISEKSMGLVILLWLFALGGLSVYHVVIINSQTLLFSFILGRCIYLQYKKTY